MDQTVELLKVDAICPLCQPLPVLHPEFYPKPHADVPMLHIRADSFPSKKALYSTETPSGKAWDFVQTLSEKQLVLLTGGNPSHSPDVQNPFGSGGLSVSGSAGETHTCAQDAPHYLASIVLADGPAGLRLQQSYQVSPDGEVVRESFVNQLVHGLFSEPEKAEGAALYYQYCTAFPVGTLLAQSFNTELLYTVGQAIGTEMAEFGVSLWLVPGMNMQRNPLCGRNYEYFSEDPFLSGLLAASLTKGVQDRSGVGVTVKHFACNNLEDNRKHSDSIVSQRALREITCADLKLPYALHSPWPL